MSSARKAAASFVALCLILSSTVAAEIRVRQDRNPPGSANSDFLFDKLPPLLHTQLTGQCRVEVVEGVTDNASGSPDVLLRGSVPESEDQPKQNFFFAQNTDGGRLRIDLPAVTELSAVQTLSWHAGQRGPQVYELYGAIGNEPHFELAPKRPVDPASCGWRLLAKVDTRPKQGEPGGQYGVLIDDPNQPLIRCKYLLLDVHRTEAADAFGNTFLSRIELFDKQELLKAAEPPPPAGTVRILINTDDSPELKPWVEKVRPILEKWYPILVDDLPSDGFHAPTSLSITFHRDKPGVADTSGTQINCATRWFSEHPDDEGALIHEMVHVVQHYQRGERPGWLVEGIADYYRWFKYEPIAKRPHPDLRHAHYTDSYQTTATFLWLLARTHGEKVIVQLNAALRKGVYKPELWKTFTGMSLDELWKEAVVAQSRPEEKQS